MDTEFEAKFYPVDIEIYRQKLLSLGAKLIRKDCKIRRSIVDRRFNPQIKCDIIRVRDEGEEIHLSAKIHTTAGGKVSDQKELEIIISDYKKMVEMLQLMNFSIDCYQESRRETWELEGAEIVIDSWPGLDPFSEIEAASENEVQRIAKLLGFDWHKKIITTVVEIYAGIYHLNIPDVLTKLDHITFDQNPFRGLPVYEIENSQVIS